MKKRIFEVPSWKLSMKTTLPLSLALRIGAQRRPQVFGEFCAYIEHSPKCRMVGSCALAAIQEELGSLPTIDLWKEAEHPVSLMRLNVQDIIVSLNDCYKWSRERIAAWLKSIGL